MAAKMDTVIALKKDEQREFYKSYLNLCCLKQLPFQSIKETSTHLEVLGDIIPMDEWGPILISLERDQSLCAISVRAKPFSQILAMDFEEQIREVCTRPILQTRFVMMNLAKALTSCLLNNDHLQSLILDGLHLSEEFIGILSPGLAKSRSLEMLALKRCGIRDVGLANLCVAIRDSSNIVALDFTQCEITDKGTMVLSELVSHQRRLRASAGWTPDGGYGAESFMGIRRITLNHNPGVGDRGASRLAAVLASPEETWIKALDLQDCGLTDLSGIRFLELLDDGNPEMEVVDVRTNEVSPCLVREILTAAGGTVDFPLLPQEKKLTIRPQWVETPEKDADCFNNSAINLRQRPASSSCTKSSVARLNSRQTVATRPTSSYTLTSNPSATHASTWTKDLPPRPSSKSSSEAPGDTFRLNLQDLDQHSDSSEDTEQTILKGLDEVSLNLSAAELKQKGKEITDAIEATRKRRLSAEEAVKRAENELREMMKTMETERLLKEEALRKREEMTGLISEIEDEEIKNLAKREMGRMVGDNGIMTFRRLKSEGDLTSKTEDSPSSDSNDPTVLAPKKNYREVTDLLEQFEHSARLNSLEFGSGLEVGRPKTANRVEAAINKARRQPERGVKTKPRSTPSEILVQLAKQSDGNSSGSGRSITSEWTFDAQMTMQSATERIAAMLRETPTVLVEEFDDYKSGEDF